jgi:hypothetical protein
MLDISPIYVRDLVDADREVVEQFVKRVKNYPALMRCRPREQNHKQGTWADKS